MPNDRNEKVRVTAGLRGASWDPSLIPADMRTSVHVLATSDGAQVVGYLHARGGETTAAFIMHPRELLVSHYLVPYLVAAGIACWVQGPRSVGNDMRLEHELAVLDVGAGMRELRELGFDKIVLLGNSGGASLFAFYNQQALRDTNARIQNTPAGRPTGLTRAVLPQADGFIFLAPHPGQGRLLLNMIDPSVIDENDALSADPTLDPFATVNGFQGLGANASYTDAFVVRYRQAQRQRVARIDAFALELAATRQRFRQQAKQGNAVDPRRAAFSGMFNVWRTDADPRCFDLTRDPSDRRWGSVWGGDPFASNLGSVGFARVCTPESWLSTWSDVTSNASFERCGDAIEQPVLMIEYTGDNSVFPSDCAAIFGSIRSGRKLRHRVRGNHHGQPITAGEALGQDVTGRLVTEWISETF